MSFDLVSINSALATKLATSDIVKCNSFTGQYGLSLTPSQALELVETRTIALQSNGRIELGGGIIDKIITAFHTSPYIYSQNYAETLHALTEMFYYYKSESLELIGDDDLIDYMCEAFNGPCFGSLELLRGRELDKLAQNLRFGHAARYDEPFFDEEEAQDEQY